MFPQRLTLEQVRDRPLWKTHLRVVVKRRNEYADYTVTYEGVLGAMTSDISWVNGEFSVCIGGKGLGLATGEWITLMFGGILADVEVFEITG